AGPKGIPDRPKSLGHPAGLRAEVRGRSSDASTGGHQMSGFHIVHAERVSVGRSFSLEVLMFGDAEFKETDRQPPGHLAAFARIAGSQEWTRIGQDGPDVPIEALDYQAEVALPTKQVHLMEIHERVWIVGDGTKTFR